MAHIEIERLSSAYDCEACGMSWADGARITIDGQVAIVLEPVAHCFGGDDYNDATIYKRILQHLGHTVSDAATDEAA
jgi:hypothetical protein